MLICSRLPPRYLRAERFHNECGPYQMQAVLSAYGKSATIPELYVSERRRTYDWTLPWDVKKLLGERGVAAEVKFWPKRSFSQAALFVLEKDCPLVFVLRSIQGKRGFHWCSIWGYDQQRDEFLVYDSQAEECEGGVGNIAYPRAHVENSLPWKSAIVLPIHGIIAAR